MTSNRRTALVVGVLFILTFVTSIGAVVAYGDRPGLDHPYISGPGADTGVLVGALLELFLIITNIGCAVVLLHDPQVAERSHLPRLRRGSHHGVHLHPGRHPCRPRSRHLAAERHRPPMRGRSCTIGKSLIDVKNWTFLLGPGFADGIGTGLLLGWLMYRSGLVHRRMALFGVIGGPLLAASGIAVLIGVIPQGSPVQSLVTVPEIVWELYLGLWLTFKGFNAAAPVLALARREQGIRNGAVTWARPAPDRQDAGSSVVGTRARGNEFAYWTANLATRRVVDRLRPGERLPFPRASAVGVCRRPDGTSGTAGIRLSGPPPRASRLRSPGVTWH